MLRLGSAVSGRSLISTCSVAFVTAPRTPVLAIRRISTSGLGTLYEEHCLRCLQSLLPGQVSLQKIGGRGDRGVDLTGWWQVPTPHTDERDVLPQRVRIFAQCKSTLSKTKKLGPVALREMEGVLGRYRTRLRVASGRPEPEEEGQDDDEGSITPYEDDALKTPLMAIICSSSGFSKATNVQVHALEGVNMLLVHLPLPKEVSLDEKIGSDESSMKSEEDVDDADILADAEDNAHPMTILCSPSLTNKRPNRLGGHFDLRWERVVQSVRAQSADSSDDGAEQTDDDKEGPEKGLRPVLLWMHNEQ